MLHDKVEQAAHQLPEEMDYHASQSYPTNIWISGAASVITLDPQPNRHGHPDLAIGHKQFSNPAVDPTITGTPQVYIHFSVSNLPLM